MLAVRDINKVWNQSWFTVQDWTGALKEVLFNWKPSYYVIFTISIHHIYNGKVNMCVIFSQNTISLTAFKFYNKDPYIFVITNSSKTGDYIYICEMHWLGNIFDRLKLYYRSRRLLNRSASTQSKYISKQLSVHFVRNNIMLNYKYEIKYPSSMYMQTSIKYSVRNRGCELGSSSIHLNFLYNILVDTTYA